MGVKHIFGPGTSMEVIVEAINQTMQEREAR